ncbi:MAG TPA: HU family DNA-binding protein [Nitrospira sp.]
MSRVSRAFFQNWIFIQGSVSSTSWRFNSVGATSPQLVEAKGESDMTKAQIIERVSEQVTTLTKRQAEIVVNTIFDCVRDSLKNGDKTEIRGFGSFRLRSRRMKEGRNPKTGATVAVPAKKVPFFKAGKELKELLNQ